MVERNDCAEFSKAVYGGNNENLYDTQNYTKITSIPNLSLDSNGYYTSDTGFTGAAYRNKNTGEIVISFRGTEPTKWSDLRNDLQIGLGKIPDQYYDAINFYAHVAAAYPGANISITGHSLGGALAQLVGAASGKETYTFNAPGVYDLLEQVGLNPLDIYSNINNYRVENDFVGNYGVHVGNEFSTGSSSENPPILGPHLDLTHLGIASAIPSRCIPQRWDTGSQLGGLGYMFSSSQDWSSSFIQAENTPVRRWDPLFLDLDGDGLETTTLNNGVYFDLDRNGYAEKTAWVGNDDGVLALDRNNDGIINNGGEIFGDQTLLNNGQLASNGYQALAEFDSNSDGKIDASDTVYSQLKVLKGDGTLKSLSDLGIKSINLNYTTTNINNSNGNVLVLFRNFEKKVA